MLSVNNFLSKASIIYFIKETGERAIYIYTAPSLFLLFRLKLHFIIFIISSKKKRLLTNIEVSKTSE